MGSGKIIYFYHDATAPVGKGLLIIEDSWSHSDTPHSVGLLWTSDQPDGETSTWKHITLTTDINDAGGIRTNNPRKRTTADPRLRQRNHSNRIQEFGLVN